MPHRSWRHRPAVAGFALAVSLGTLVAMPTPAHAAPGSPSGLQTLGEVQAGLPVLSWKPVATATSYQVQVGDTDFDSPLVSITTDNVAYAWNKVIPAGVHVWRVRAVDAQKDVSAWSQGEFDVARTPAPNPIAPGNGDTLAQPDDAPLLQWTVVPGATTYTVQVDDEDGFAGPNEYETAASSLVLPDPLSPAKAYYWRVKATRGTGLESAYSATREFQVGALPFPVVVPGPSPMVDVVLDWRPVPGARYYELQVSTDDDFAQSTIIDDKTKITGTRYSPKVTYDNNNQYYWRVRAVGSTSTTTVPNVSAWSPDLNQFRTAYAEAPSPVYPLSTTDEVADPLFYQWTPVAHATRYELQVGTDPNFSGGTFESCQTAATTYTPAAFTYNLVTGSTKAELCYPGPGTVSYWRVRPLDLPFDQVGASVPGVQGLFSETQSFVYFPDAFGRLDDDRAFEPSNGEVVDVPTLRWKPDQQAETYKVVVRDKDGDQVASATTFAESFTPRTALDPADNPFTWSVNAIEADGEPGSLVYTNSFRVSGNPPTVDGVPLTGTEGIGTSLRTPHLSWVPQPGATSYVVRVVRPDGVAADAGTALMKVDLAYNEVTETTKTYLTPGTYDWYVSAATPSGTVVGPRNTFTIAQLPAVTGQRLALDGDTLAAGDGCAGSLGTLPDTSADTCPDVPSTPVLSWDPVPGAAMYVVYMSEEDRFTNLLEATSTMSATSNTYFTPQIKARAATYPDSQAGTDASYFWHVRPCKSTSQCAADPVSASPSRATNKLRKKSPAITGGTASVGTSDGSEVTFSWQDYRETNAATTWAPTGEKPHQSAQLYRLQVATSDSFGTILEEVSVDQPTYTSFTKIYRDGPVFWRVQAIDADDNQLSWSPTYRFDKAGPPVQLEAPINNDAISGSVPLQWQAQAYAQKYEVQVASNNDVNFSAENILFTESTPQTAYTWDEVIPASTTPYVWRVRRIDSVGNTGAWSAARRFTNPGSNPSLTLPQDGAVVPASRALFYWTLVPGASTYKVEVRRGSRLETYTTAANAYAPTSALTTGSCTWRVVALDASRRLVGVSASRNFTVDATAPKIVKVTPSGTVSRRAVFKVTFDERVVGVSRGTVRIVKRGSRRAIPATVTLSSTGRVASIRPRTRLARLTTYELLVGPGIRDTQGNTMRADSFRFRTGR